MAVLLPDYSMLAVPIMKNGQLTSYLQAMVVNNKICFNQNTDPNYLAIFNALFSTNPDRLKATREYHTVLNPNAHLSPGQSALTMTITCVTSTVSIGCPDGSYDSCGDAGVNSVTKCTGDIGGGDDAPTSTMPITPPSASPGGGGGGYAFPNPQQPQDPCGEARIPAQKATDINNSSAMTTAKTNIDSKNDGNEHSAVLKVSGSGYIVESYTNGDGGTVSPIIDNLSVASIHNHPNGSPWPSEGDVYALIENNKKFPGYTTSYVYYKSGSGDTYALVLTNKGDASKFATDHPHNSTSITGHPTTVFPEDVSDYYYNLITYYGMSWPDALARTLDNFDSGVALLKLENGTFKKINIIETKNTNEFGDSSFTAVNCN